MCRVSRYHYNQKGVIIMMCGCAVAAMDVPGKGCYASSRTGFLYSMLLQCITTIVCSLQFFRFLAIWHGVHAYCAAVCSQRGALE